MEKNDENPKYDVGSDNVFSLNPDPAPDLCAIIRTENNLICFYVFFLLFRYRLASPEEIQII